MPKQEFQGQFPDEEVLLVFRRHPIVMRKGLLALLFFVVIGAFAGLFISEHSNAMTIGQVLSSFSRPLAAAFFAGFIVLFYYWIGWHYSICIITNQRFVQITQEGIFRGRSVNDIPLNRILNVNYKIRGMVETLLGFGTIIVQTLVGDFIITKVPKPAKTQTDIVTAIKESGIELDEEFKNDAS